MPSSRRSSRKGAALLAASVLAAIAVAVAGCGSGGSPAPTTPATGIPTVEDAWVRPPMAADRPAAGYLTIRNPGTEVDALVGASSPVAMSVEVHETTMDSSGMAGMHPIDRLEIPAGGSVTLEPGGYHLMLMEVEGELEVGSTVEIELQFESGASVTVEAEVKAG